MAFKKKKNDDFPCSNAHRHRRAATQPPSPPRDSPQRAECSSGVSQGCVPSVVDKMKCEFGTYADKCNVCQCAKVISRCYA